MFNLLKVEFYKLKRFQIGYIAILFAVVVGYLYGDNRIGNKVFEMTDNTAVAFSYVVSDNSFVFLISIVTALFMGKDFSYRTICNDIKLGHSRFHILFSRMVMVCIFAILFHVMYIVSTIFGFSVVRGFDTSMFCVENALWLLTVLVQLVAVTSGVVFISFLAKKVSEAIVLSALFSVIGCNVLRNFISAKIYTSSCFYFVQNNRTGDLVSAAVSALVTMMVFLVSAAMTFEKAEVK